MAGSGATAKDMCKSGGQWRTEKAVLTDGQRATLGETGGKPMSMLQVCPVMGMTAGREA